MNTRRLYILLRKSLLVCVMLGIAAPLYAQDIPLTTQSDEAKTLFVEGRTLFDNLRFDEARKVFDEALQKDPQFALANVYRALSSTTDSDFVRHLSEAVSVKSEVSDGERLLIESVKANADNEPQKALVKLEEALETHPNDKRLHHMLGLAYQGVDMNEKAEQAYKKATEIDSNFAPPYNNLGYLYRSTENYVMAEEAFKNYIRLLPDEANPHDSIADLYTKMGNHDLAITHYEKALELNPNFYFSQQKIGDNLIFKGLYEDGREAYRTAMEIAPSETNKIFIQQGMANSYLYEGNHERASIENMNAIKMAEQASLPENASTLYQLRALMDIEQNRFEDAEQSLMACDKIMSNHTLTDNRQHTLKVMSTKNRAIKAAKQGDFDKANEKATKLKEWAQENENTNEMEDYHLLAGIIALEKGEYANAVTELEQADKNSPYAQFYLATSYQQADMTEKARQLFTKVAKWNENSAEYALVRNRAEEAAKMDIVVE